MHGVTCRYPARTGPAENQITPVAAPRVAAQRPCRICLPAGPPAAVQARRHVWAIIHTWDVPIDAYAAALLTSDLVTEVISRDENATVQLMISWVDSQFRVEVCDVSNPGSAGPGLLSGGEGGSGLALAVQARRNLRLPKPEPDRQGQ